MSTDSSPTHKQHPAPAALRRRDLLLPALLGAAGTPRAEPGRRKRLGLALGSGSMHGLAHIGVQRALERLQQPVHAIAGTSAGAIVGALWAAGLDARQVEAIERRLDWSRSTSWVLPLAGLVRNDGLQRALDEAVGGRRIEQLPIAFAAVATDAANGERIALTRGPVGASVGASSAIPVLFEPVRIGSRDLVDGSLTAPVPVDVARELGAAVVVAVDVAYRPGDAPASGLMDRAFQALHIMINALAAEQTRRADLTLRLALHQLMRDGDNPAALIAAGDAALVAAWPRIERLLAA